MELSIKIFKGDEWLHFNELNHELNEFYDIVDYPEGTYDLFELVKMEYEKAIPEGALHLLWTNRILSTHSQILN